ncbi:hypothetical protein D0469_06960 [Peribacillus saganii]|uniref:Phage portal protein n=1 Tax=Peribacillus saganii TaxID=2303992 RepID=A0A372LQ40_9BACI|nr:hypothetical protein [Peribacillus saganii]RFU70333.1 hypothetical protein D0469_06960 [Peribacillus saganii]
MNGNSHYTKDWELYIAGKNYNNRLKPNYYDTVDTNLAFFHDDQWRNVGGNDNMPKPQFNILKRVITFLVASLTTSKTKLHFEPLLYSINKEETNNIDISDFANAQVSNLFEKWKMDFKIKDALFDASITGDCGAHLYFDMSKRPYGGSGAFKGIKGEIELELVDGVNVYFGNANNRRVDSQPYIIIAGRSTVKELQAEAKRYKQDERDINTIDSDLSYMEQAGDAGKIEVETDGDGKALYIIVYRKKKVKRVKKDEFGNEITNELGEKETEEVETIMASKSVENAYIYKDIDTELSCYPFAWLNWEKQKNQYHGKAVCTGILPNQIFINRMFAMVMYHLMMSAFPKAVYNADLISNWNNEIGSAIGVRGVGLETNIKNVAGYLEPGTMSNQIFQVIDLAMQFTKECLGISDAAIGNIKPDNTSAIIAVQKSSAIPLENPRANLYEWIEDIGKIIFDMMGAYYGTRPVVLEQNGEKTVVDFDFTQFKDHFFNVRADVGESSFWSEIAALQTLDNLLASDRINFLQYLERVPDELIPQKQQLITEVKAKIEADQQALLQQQQVDAEQLISQLSPEEQQAFYSAPPELQQQMLAQIQQPQAPQM